VILSALAMVFALVAGGWAALLALAEEAPRVARTLSDQARGEETPASLYRAIYVSRISLLLVAGVTAAQAVRWWERPAVEALVAVAVILGFLGMVAEALPRAIGALVPDVAAAAAPMAGKTVTPFRPLLALVTLVERAVERVLPRPSDDENPLEAAQRDLLLGVFSLGDTTVAEIMTPRLDIVALDTEAEWREVVEVLRKSEHARIPVYSDNLDNIVGILYAKDLVAPLAGAAPVPARWQDLVRPSQFVPESKPLAAQLRDFQLSPSHAALVVDEFGGTSGLITREDVLEEVVGEIRDEYDEDEKPAVEREGEDKFWVDGSVTLDELTALLGTTVEDDDVSTVGGWVYSELGHVPRPGEEFRFGQFRVVVEQVVRRRIHRVYFERGALEKPVNGGSRPVAE
jgi:CBS domain containing-hemolysin-like protein